MLRSVRLAVVLITGFALLATSTQTSVAAERRELVLFPFDDYALPFNKGLILTLLPGRKGSTNNVLGSDPDHPGNPVLNVGKPGDPDFPRAYFYGTVLHIDGEYRMWYSGRDNDKSRHICYAVSKDGLKWEKPKLGLVDYHGSRANNLVATDDKLTPGMIALVIHDKDDPDPKRRFKMIREITPAEIWASVSADGLTWHSINEGKDVIKGSNLEPSGFIRHDGVYYLNGHGGPIPHPIQARGTLRPQKRMMVTLMSYDFVNWTEAGHLSYRRDNIPPRPVLDFDFNRGEQMHLGAGLWDRGNVILGFYGMYHNPLTDRREVTVDIGLLVSHDAIHFKEPVPDFQIIPGAEEEDRAEQRITQAQGFQNIGNTSYVYYGIWTEINRDSATGVRVATWPRDRFGYFSPAIGVEGAHCVSSLVNVDAEQPQRVYLNATGMTAESRITVEVLDEQFRPVEGYTATDLQPINDDSGLKLPLAWGKNKTLPTGKPVRLRVNFDGLAAEAAKFYALYVE
ncbi:MAG: hypothetical protein J0M17_20640 [Planctomycetes bacterium]|nr:hypothetical protein [Planctomycetota bacterium]